MVRSDCVADTHMITVEPLGPVVVCREGQATLDACLRAGVWLTHACTQRDVIHVQGRGLRRRCMPRRFALRADGVRTGAREQDRRGFYRDLQDRYPNQSVYPPALSDEECDGERNGHRRGSCGLPDRQGPHRLPVLAARRIVAAPENPDAQAIVPAQHLREHFFDTRDKTGTRVPSPILGAQREH